MKRLLLIAALASALIFVFCHHAGPHGQEITVFKAEPQAPVLETPAAPVVVPPPVKPAQRHHRLPKPRPHRQVKPLDLRPSICTGDQP